MFESVKPRNPQLVRSGVVLSMVSLGCAGIAVTSFCLAAAKIDKRSDFLPEAVKPIAQAAVDNWVVDEVHTSTFATTGAVFGLSAFSFGTFGVNLMRRNW